MNKLKVETLLLLPPLLACLIGAPYSATAQAVESIGRVLSTSGSVIAQTQDGTTRKLQRRSSIYEGDLIITESSSRAQIRFSDRGLIALRPDTRFLIEEHKFSGVEDGTESASYRLLDGGIQAITGLIGNKNKSQYRFETPLADISLRGTHWGVTFCNNSCGNLPPGLYGGVAEGGIDVCNGGGCEGFDKDGYFYVPDEGTKPQTLLEPPTVVFDDSTGRDQDGDEDDGDNQGQGQPAQGTNQDDGQGQAGDDQNDGDDGQTGSDGSAGDGGASGLSNGPGTSDTGGGTPDADEQVGTTTDTEFDQQEVARDTNAGEGNGNAGGDGAMGEDGEDGGAPTLEDLVDDSNRDTDGDGISDAEDPDADGDGVLDALGELPAGFVAIDTDGDGILDDFAIDTDGDGIADISDPDADGNGVLDELGDIPVGFTAIDTDGDGVADALAADTDNDGIADTDDPDADGDGVLDELGAVPFGFVAIDSDGDGIADTLAEDSDGDGIANADDIDADGNGLLDEIGDVPSGFVAVDTDGDGIADTFAEDTDGDGIANAEDIDADGNGVLDQLGEIPSGFVAIDTDGDGIADVFAEDSDGDGIANADDSDADGNGVLDELGDLPAGFVAVDTDGDGIADVFAEDTDGDGIPNSEDIDANGDGILDTLGVIPSNFIALDTNGDGIADTLAADSDGDGIIDANDPTPNGEPIVDPEPELSIAVAFAVVGETPANSAISDVFVIDESTGNSIEQDANDAVIAVNRDDGSSCNSCLFDVDFSASNPVLNDSMSYTSSEGNISASLGRWTGLINVEESGDGTNAPDLHYVTTENIAESLPTAVGAAVVSYSLDSGLATMPTDGAGVAGSLDILDMDFDFASQQLDYLDLEASFGDGRLYAAGLTGGSVNLTDILTRDIGITGTCIGGACGANEPINGSTSFAFLADGNASALTGGYSLNTSSFDTSIAGVYVLEQDPILTPAPANSLALTTGIFDAGTGTSLANTLALGGTGKNAISVSGAADISTVETITHDSGSVLTGAALVSGVFSSDLANFDAIGEDLNPPQQIDCTNCLDVDLTPGAADLSDTVMHVAANYTAYWGRWSDQPVSFNLGNGAESYNAADLFYAYSEDLTPDTSAAAIGSTTIGYSRILGSNPIDQDGVSGTLGSVAMEINYGSQQITSFEINLSTADGDWFAHLPYIAGTTIQEAAALSGAVNSFAVQGLASDPTGGITAAGTSNRYDVYGDVNTGLLGPNADAVLGTYNLSVIDTLGAPQDAEAIGTFLLEQNP